MKKSEVDNEVIWQLVTKSSFQSKQLQKWSYTQTKRGCWGKQRGTNDRWKFVRQSSEEVIAMRRKHSYKVFEDECLEMGSTIASFGNRRSSNIFSGWKSLTSDTIGGVWDSEVSSYGWINAAFILSPSLSRIQPLMLCLIPCQKGLFWIETEKYLVNDLIVLHPVLKRRSHFTEVRSWMLRATDQGIRRFTDSHSRKSSVLLGGAVPLIHYQKEPFNNLRKYAGICEHSIRNGDWTKDRSARKALDCWIRRAVPARFRWWQCQS